MRLQGVEERKETERVLLTIDILDAIPSETLDPLKPAEASTIRLKMRGRPSLANRDP